MNSPYLLEQLVRIRQEELRRMGSAPRAHKDRSDVLGLARRMAPKGKRTAGMAIPQAAWHR